MMTAISTDDRNPFADAGDQDRARLWDMLVHRDIDAFLQADWDRIAGDFVPSGFFGISGRRGPDAEAVWMPAFPDLPAYRTEWLRQARDVQQRADCKTVRAALFHASALGDIAIGGSLAVVHKLFDGYLPLADGRRERLCWRTVYFCRKISGCWKIASFIGYLDHEAG